MKVPPVFVVLLCLARLIAPQTADARPKPELTVEIDEGRPVFIHSRKSFDCVNGINHGGGCTRVQFYVETGDVVRASDGGIAKMTLKTGLRNVEVELSSDLRKKSCLFNATLKHELTHLALHREVLRRFSPEIAKAALAAIEKMPPPLTAAQVGRINGVLKRQVDHMVAQDREQNALLDSDAAYSYQDSQCAGKK